MRKEVFDEPFRRNESIYFIQKTDLEKCARLMAKAFGTDPSIRYLLGGNKEGKNDWKYFHAVLKALFGRCVMLSPDKDIHALFVALPPSLREIPMLKFLLNGGVFLPFISQKGLAIRSIKYESNCQKIKSRLISDNTWYCLCYIVEPSMQHQGIGSALMRYVLGVLDTMNASLYLETHKAVNVEIYKHFGFELKDTSVIPNTNILQYALLRKA